MVSRATAHTASHCSRWNRNETQPCVPLSRLCVLTYMPYRLWRLHTVATPPTNSAFGRTTVAESNRITASTVPRAAAIVPPSVASTYDAPSTCRKTSWSHAWLPHCRPMCISDCPPPRSARPATYNMQTNNTQHIRASTAACDTPRATNLDVIHVALRIQAPPVRSS